MPSVKTNRLCLSDAGRKLFFWSVRLQRLASSLLHSCRVDSTTPLWRPAPAAFLRSQLGPQMKLLLDNAHAQRERRGDWHPTAALAHLSLSNRWANYCCCAQRAFHRSNTLWEYRLAHARTHTLKQTCLFTHTTACSCTAFHNTHPTIVPFFFLL